MSAHPDEPLTEACHHCRKRQPELCERVLGGQSCFARRMVPASTTSALDRSRADEWRKVATNRRHRIQELEGENVMLRVALEAVKELRIGVPRSEITDVIDAAMEGLERSRS